jgi:mannose-1-phosphate guanylyltransferase
MNKQYFAVIMGGGIGSRFWPMSTQEHPKQFIDILGVGSTLIQQTFKRLKQIVPVENILVVTTQEYKDLVLSQLPEIKSNNILCEPARKNTAPCIAYAAYKIAQINPNAKMIVAPADHLILDEATFCKNVEKAFSLLDQESCLVTLSIKPSRPDTGYGYIQFDIDSNASDEQIKKVKTFTEKPNLTLAQQFLESGDFYWNSGIFIWKAQIIIDAFEKYLPDMSEIFKDRQHLFATPQEELAIQQIYSMTENISIDYGIMEKAENVFTVLSDFGWSDLGTWGSLYEHLPKDNEQNTVAGKNVYMFDTKGCMIKTPINKTIVLQGLQDYIVIDTEEVLLICKKQNEQDIKKYVAQLGNKKNRK